MLNLFIPSFIIYDNFQCAYIHQEHTCWGNTFYGQLKSTEKDQHMQKSGTMLQAKATHQEKATIFKRHNINSYNSYLWQQDILFASSSPSSTVDQDQIV